LKKTLLSLTLALTLFTQTNLLAQESQTTTETKKMSFFDKDDGMLDASEYLSELYGFLPVPVIITEPAIGYGGGVGLVYFHDTFLGKKSASGRAIPASISALFGVATENGTRMGGVVHIGYYLEDTLRTVTFLAYSDININTFVKELPIAANMNGPLGYQALKFRVNDSALFLGAGYIYTSLESSLKATTPDPAGPQDINIVQNNTEAAAQLVLEYDTRDNTLSPSSGYFLNIKANFFNEAVGGDHDFQRHMLKSFFYMPVTDKINVNLNISAETLAGTGEDTPFYMYPFVMLRGVPIMAIQGEHIASSELELVYEATPRWDLLAFSGVGKAFGTNQFNKIDQSFSDSKNNYSGGVGFRYLVASKFGLKVGVDIATSEYDNAFYIQMGSAWAGF